jgi:hypothetical protein
MRRPSGCEPPSIEVVGTVTEEERLNDATPTSMATTALHLSLYLIYSFMTITLSQFQFVWRNAELAVKPRELCPALCHQVLANAPFSFIPMPNPHINKP